MKTYSLNGTLYPSPPFDFEKSLDFIEMFRPMAGEQVLAPRSLSKAVSINGKPVLFQVTSSGSIAAPAIQYQLYAAQPIDGETQRKAEDRIAFFLSLDDDLGPFYSTGLDDPFLEPVIRKQYGLHQVKFLTPFEIAVWAVLVQRLAIPIAKKNKQALVERYGSALEINGSRAWAFPEPLQMAAASPAELTGLVKNERKVEYLLAVIQAFQDVDEEFLRCADFRQVKEWLLNIRGIGDWSAHFILVRGLGRMMEAGTVGSGATIRFEPHLAEAVESVYGRGAAQDPAEIQRLLARYADHQGYWAYYLRAGH